jgi:hypothetical protein
MGGSGRGNMRCSDRVKAAAHSKKVLCTFGLVVLASIVSPTLAVADEVEDLLRKGIDLRREGRDQDALETFRKANQLASTPRTVAQMGLAEQALGRWTDAFEHVEWALLARTDPWIAKNRSVLESSLTTIRKHVGEVEILGDPKGAEVRVDGRLQGTLPLARSIHAAAGTVSVEVRAPGYLTVTRSVIVTPAELTRETIFLQQASSTSAAQAEPAREPERAIASGEGAGPSGEHRSPSWGRRLAWVGVVGAGLFAIGGATALLLRESKAQWFSDQTHACDENLSNKGSASCQDAYQTGQTATKLAVGSFIAAGVLGAGATALFLTTPSSSDASHGSTAGLACAPLGGQFGVTCATRF